MTTPSAPLKSIPIRVLASLMLIRGGYGLTLGLYLYVNQVVLLDALERTGVGEAMRLSISTWVLAFVVFWIALMEYPTGVVGDLFGRRLAMTTGFVFRGLFFAAFLGVWAVGRWPVHVGDIPPSVWVVVTVVVSWVLFGIGYGLLSGTVTAWLNDSLDEAGCYNRFAAALAWGHLAYWVTFLVGSLVALLLYNARLPQVLFLLGLFTSLTVAVLCALTTGENKFYQFRRLGDVFGQARKKMAAEYAAIWRAGRQVFMADVWRFGAITLVGAAIHTLRDFIDYSWVTYCKDQRVLALDGNEGIASFGRLTWLVLALTVVYLVGHTAVLALIRRWEVGGREVTGRRLVGLNIGLNLLFSLPVLGLFVGMTFLVAPGTNAGFLVFAVLIALYAFFQGASDSPRESLDNAYIPARTQERASVLSLIEVLRKMIAAVVIFALGFVVNTSEAMLWAWAVLTVAVVALTLALPAAMRGQYAAPADGSGNGEALNGYPANDNRGS